MVKRQLRLDAVFSALSDPTRRKIVERLGRGVLTVGEIASAFPISGPAVSKHVRILEHAGLVTRTVTGRTHHLRLCPPAIRVATSWFERQERYWTEAFDRIDVALTGTAPSSDT